MESASKALIIAGAILISILTISGGIVVYNSSRGTTNQAGATGDLLKAQAEKTTDFIEDELKNEIRFYLEENDKGVVNRITLRAEKDMTWGEFINSSYNSYGFINSYGNIMVQNRGDMLGGVTVSLKKYYPSSNSTQNIVQTSDMKIVSDGQYCVTWWYDPT